jgi:hypothetical protein
MTRLAIPFLMLLACTAHAQVGDTIHSHRIKGVTSYGQYFGFDAHDHNNLLLTMQAIRYVLVPIDSEMGCFAANHDKESLRVKYDIWEYSENGETKRWYRLQSMESEKGDLSWEWREKERKDPVLLERHHKVLRDAIQWSTGSK